ncbi:MAG: H-NS histone family protein [Azonexus sp.]|jgi:DNA-binding protein H-NS|nr:H-NS histone family protein [Betaproteobacteria bacterium]MBK8918309.1 H-NS histone family protein [Betaproteobacteria bacterium]MBP6037582.1 H-NS histone family protein [Azonexus sp.]
MEFSKFSDKQLRDLLQKIPAELKKREGRERAKALEETKAFAKSRGFSLEELVGGESKPSRSRGVVPVKYRHPKDSSLAWTGRGRKPKWVEAWLNGGGKIESLVI